MARSLLVDLTMSIFEVLVFWNPRHPLVCVHIDLKQIWAIPASPFQLMVKNWTQMVFPCKIIGRLCDGNSNLLDALKNGPIKLMKTNFMQRKKCLIESQWVWHQERSWAMFPSLILISGSNCPKFPIHNAVKTFMKLDLNFCSPKVLQL